MHAGACPQAFACGCMVSRISVRGVPMCMAPRVATSGELVRVAAVLLPCLVFCQSAGT